MCCIEKISQTRRLTTSTSGRMSRALTSTHDPEKCVAVFREDHALSKGFVNPDGSDDDLRTRKTSRPVERRDADRSRMPGSLPGSWERSCLGEIGQSARHGPSRANRSGGFFLARSKLSNCPARAGTGDPDPGARAIARVPKRAGPAGGNEAMSRTPMAERTLKGSQIAARRR